MKNSDRTGIIRKLDDLGRIVIPKEFRTKLNFNNNESVEMELVGNCVVLKKPIDCCMDCGQPTSELANKVGLSLCDNCIETFGKKFNTIKNEK